MEWLVVYRTVEGLEGKVVVRAEHIPNYKSAARHVMAHAYPDRPPVPLGNLSAEQWLERCGVEIIDVERIKAPTAGR